MPTQRRSGLIMPPPGPLAGQLRVGVRDAGRAALRRLLRRAVRARAGAPGGLPAPEHLQHRLGARHAPAHAPGACAIGVALLVTSSNEQRSLPPLGPRARAPTSQQVATRTLSVMAAL